MSVVHPVASLYRRLYPLEIYETSFALYDLLCDIPKVWCTEFVLPEETLTGQTLLGTAVPASRQMTNLSSPNSRTVGISIRATFGSSLFWEWSSKGQVSQLEVIKPNNTAKLWKIRNEVFCRCFSQWQARWRKCVLARGCPTMSYLRVLPLQFTNTIPRTFGLPIIMSLQWVASPNKQTNKQTTFRLSALNAFKATPNFARAPSL
jgi:hypothetical protein